MRTLIAILLFICTFAPAAAQDSSSPAGTANIFSSLIGGIEQVDLSSKPSGTEGFARAYFQSPGVGGTKNQFRAWGTVRLLGAPTQTDTNGIFSVFTDPTGQITSDKLSSVGASIDFTVGGAYRIPKGSNYDSVDIILGFGGTTPLQGDTVSQAFTAPVFGTQECNILYTKLATDFKNPGFSVKQSPDGVATGSTTACLLNTSAPTTTTGTTTYSPITTIAFSNSDRTSFFLKDVLGVRFNHTTKGSGTDKCDDKGAACYLGTVDLTFGQDSAITGGVFRGNRWIFKTDAIYPLVTPTVTFYLFGSFSARMERNETDNTPLILQPATLSTLTGASTTAIPNVNTVVLALHQPDRDFYRIGVGVDLMSLIKKK